jgi:molybdopterin-guanine dinucleotide biosynthesis protein A
MNPLTNEVEKADNRLPITACILCGGQSKRMGRAKAFLPFRNKTIIEHLVQTLEEVADEVLIVTNDVDTYSSLEVDIVKDILPNRGPLAGIFSTLLVAKHQRVFAIPCDMPLITPKLVSDMLSMKTLADVVLIEDNGAYSDFPAIWSKAALPKLEEYFFTDSISQSELLAQLKISAFKLRQGHINHQTLPPYFDVDTPKDYSYLLCQSQ